MKFCKVVLKSLQETFKSKS